MGYRTALAVSLLLLSAYAQAASPCDEKKQAIAQEIGYAKQHNNQNRINGLKKALSEVQAHCSDENTRVKYQKKIVQQRNKVAERKRELAEAKVKGDAGKIADKRRKFNEAHKELQTLEARGD